MRVQKLRAWLYRLRAASSRGSRTAGQEAPRNRCTTARRSLSTANSQQPRWTEGESEERERDNWRGITREDNWRGITGAEMVQRWGWRLLIPGDVEKSESIIIKMESLKGPLLLTRWKVGKHYSRQDGKVCESESDQHSISTPMASAV